MLNKHKKKIGVLMLSLFAFSAVHMSIVLAAQGFNDVQTPIDHHQLAQPHENSEGDHLSCANDLNETFRNRINTDHHDNLADCHVALPTPVAVSPQTFLLLFSVPEFSKKPITLTHNIALLI